MRLRKALLLGKIPGLPPSASPSHNMGQRGLHLRLGSAGGKKGYRVLPPALIAGNGLS